MNPGSTGEPGRRWRAALGLAFIGIAFVAVLSSLRWSRSGPQDRLVVYCAHDAVYSERVLREFERRTGIEVAIRFDTEATKSLGLVELIARERNRPRCDVFWNNEQLGTVWLAEQGLFEAYRGEGYARIPDPYKDPDGRWTGFAGRMRVWIVNTQAVEPSPAAIDAVLDGPDLSRVAIAKPLYGTTRTHYTVFWDHWGPDRTQKWHHDWRERGVIEVNGNALVKELVATGTCHLGLTDTDDFFAATDEGKPVAMAPVRLDNGSTIVIPNTVAIVRGTRHLEHAKRLVDYLLSAETELALARSPSRQIPLGPVDPGQVPEQVRELVGGAERAYPLSGLSRASAQCLAWLREEYLQ